MYTPLLGCTHVSNAFDFDIAIDYVSILRITSLVEQPLVIPTIPYLVVYSMANIFVDVFFFFVETVPLIRVYSFRRHITI